MYEVFDHTADVGLRIHAENIDDLFQEAGAALTSLLVDDPGSVTPQDEAKFDIAGSQWDYLLFDWLNELLYRFETEQRLFSRFEVHVGEHGLKGTAWGETVDFHRHRLSHEVKAVTYHRLNVERTGDVWLAEVILDI